MLRVLLSITALVAIIAYMAIQLKQYEQKLALTKNGKTVYVEVLSLSCGRKDYISFKYGNQVIKKSIYLTNDECRKLQAESEIGIKVNHQGLIIFANNDYNDWMEAELVATFLLGAFFSFCICYYGISPVLKSKALSKVKSKSH